MSRWFSIACSSVVIAGLVSLTGCEATEWDRTHPSPPPGPGDVQHQSVSSRDAESNPYDHPGDIAVNPGEADSRNAPAADK